MKGSLQLLANMMRNDDTLDYTANGPSSKRNYTQDSLYLKSINTDDEKY